MPKNNKRSNKPTSDTSREKSEVCSPVVCEPRCEKDYPIKSCPCYTPEEIVSKYGNAVVGIRSEFILSGNGVTGIGSVTGGTPLAANVRSDVVLDGNGFFIKGHYIVAPAQLVLLPPSLTSVANRYPYFDPNSLELGSIRNQLVRASRILVNVFNVNGQGHSFNYEADLVGVDGAGDIAVLRINYGSQYNLCNPCIEKCHPYFKFGSSRASIEGEKVYLLGDYISNPFDQRRSNCVNAITEGLISDHRYLEHSGWILPELVLVSAPAYAFSAGLPIINCQAEVIGMQTTDLASVLPRISLLGSVGLSLNQSVGSGFVSGPSEFFMRRIVSALIKGTCSRKTNCNLELICDPVGAFYRYRKAYAGIAYDVFNGADYDVTTDFTSGVAPFGLPRIRLTPNGNFLNSPSCKEIIGIRVLGLAGANPNDALGVANGYHFVPGGVDGTLFPVLPISPFLGRLLPGDIITHINGIPLGDLGKQIAPSLVTWRLCGGDQINICYRRGGNSPNNVDNSFTENYDQLYTFTSCLADYPALLDYPWYAVNIFPLLSSTPFPGFVFPAGQITNPQYPALTLGAPFHPAF